MQIINYHKETLYFSHIIDTDIIFNPCSRTALTTFANPNTPIFFNQKHILKAT